MGRRPGRRSCRPRGSGAAAAPGAGGGRKGAPCRLRGLRPARTQNRDGNLCRQIAVLCDGSRGTLIQQIIKTLGTNYKIENEFLTIVLNKSNPEF